MFENVGGKIKGLAVIVCWLGIIGSVITALVLWAANSYRTPTIGLGIGVLVIGSLVSWISSFAAYALGEITENSEQQTAILKALCEEQKKMNESLFQMKTKSSIVSADVFENPNPVSVVKSVTDEPRKRRNPEKNNADNDQRVVYVDRSKREMQCPYCNKIQKADRNLCYNCGALFVDAAD